MSLLDMYRILEYPDPEKLARNAIMEQTDPMYLYDEVSKGENIDFEAIRNLLAIQYNNTGTPLPIEYNVPDVKLMTRYLDTLIAYLRGEEIHQELLAYSSLTFDAQAEVMEHFREQKEITEELLNQQMSEQGSIPGMEQMPPMPEQMPVEGGLPPQGVPQAQIQPPLPMPGMGGI
jgi:hypothetical protein